MSDMNSEAASGRSNRKNLAIFTILLSVSIINSFVYTALTVALPPIMSEMAVSASTVQWLTSAYSLVMGIMVLATAYLIKRFPAKSLFRVNMLIFIAGLLLAALAGNFYILLAGRLLQAAASGIQMSLTQVVILTIFPAGKRGTIMGIFGLAVTAAPVIAPTLAGLLIDSSGWPMIFWISLILTVIVSAIGFFLMENLTVNEKQRFDLLSMVLCSISLTGLLIGVGRIGSYAEAPLLVWLPVIASLITGFLFVSRQLKLDKPFLDLRILGNRTFRLAVIVSIMIYAILIAVATLLPIYIQSLRGFTATESGLITLPGSLITAIFSYIAGRLYDRFGIRKIYLTGTALLFAGSAGFVLFDAATPLWLIISLFAVRSIGIGLLMMPTVTWGMSKLAKNQYSDGTALLSSLRTIAGALGAAAFVSVMTIIAGSSVAADMIRGLQAAFLILALMAGALLILAWTSVKDT